MNDDTKPTEFLYDSEFYADAKTPADIAAIDAAFILQFKWCDDAFDATGLTQEELDMITFEEDMEWDANEELEKMYNAGRTTQEGAKMLTDRWKAQKLGPYKIFDPDKLKQNLKIPPAMPNY
jgi:hypothetical protein